MELSNLLNNLLRNELSNGLSNELNNKKQAIPRKIGIAEVKN